MSIKPMLAPADAVKTVALPFAGFYESIYTSDLDYLDDGGYITAAAAEYLTDEMNYSQYEAAFMARYVDFLTGAIGAHLGGVTFTDHAPYVEKYAGGTVGLNAKTDVSTWPTLAGICKAFDGIIDIKAACIEIASERLTSRDGFASFYDPDIKQIFNAPLVNWQWPYIEILLAAIVQGVALDDPHVYDLKDSDSAQQAAYALELHSFYTEFLCGRGDSMETLALNTLTEAQAAEYHALNEGDQNDEE